VPFAIRTASIMDDRPCSYCRVICRRFIKKHGIGSSVAESVGQKPGPMKATREKK
jgi:hypothetical protein